MSEHEIVTAAQAEIKALTELARDIAADRNRWRQRAEHAEALLIQHGLATADEATEPEDGVCAEQSSAP